MYYAIHYFRVMELTFLVTIHLSIWLIGPISSGSLCSAWQVVEIIITSFICGFQHVF